MEEVIKYFESLEARINSLEKAQAQLIEKQQANDEKLVALGEKIMAIGGHISQMMHILEEVQNQPAPVVEEEPEEEPIIEEPVVEGPIIEPEPEVIPEEPVVAPKPEVSPDETGETPEEKGTIQPELFVEENSGSKAMLYGTPVDDIRKAISLGDRFLYQRELFGQNAELMQKTLTDLNALRSFDEAVSYIMTHFKWDTESSTYQQFLVTLHRRFG